MRTFITACWLGGATLTEHSQAGGRANCCLLRSEECHEEFHFTVEKLGVRNQATECGKKTLSFSLCGRRWCCRVAALWVLLEVRRCEMIGLVRDGQSQRSLLLAVISEASAYSHWSSFEIQSEESQVSLWRTSASWSNSFTEASVLRVTCILPF